MFSRKALRFSFDAAGAAGLVAGRRAPLGAPVQRTSKDGCLNSFQPFGEDSFQIMTYGWRLGGFASTNGLTSGNGTVLALNYASSGLTLTTLSGPTNAVPPRLSAQREPSGLLRLRLAGATGLTHVLQASTNLTDWITLLTTNTPSGVVEFVDPESVQLPQRFYRAFTE